MMEVEPRCEQVSYLQARDPSIISYNRSKFSKIRCNLIPLMNETKVDAFMKIYLRLNGDVPVSPIYQVDDNVFSCQVPTSQLKNHWREGDILHKNYSFSKIFDKNACQIEIFNTIVKPKMFDLMNGFNSTFLTYGASGSGKTYTIVGTEIDPGVIPRALEYLFRSLPLLDDLPKVKAMEGGSIKILSDEAQIYASDMKKELIKYFDKVSGAHSHKETYKMMQQRLSEQPIAIVDCKKSDLSLAVWISFAEIYNENIYDLLQHNKNRPKLILRLRQNGDPYIKGLTSVFVSTGLEAYQILRYGLTNLNYAATALNDHSSRSHCIFTIQLVQSYGKNSSNCISSFNFCDLAGSERLKKTNNVGDRLKESNSINTSLMVLGRCLKEVRDSQKHKENRTIPFRDSKLTMFLQHAISGRDNLSMIVNVNPSDYMYPETQHVLNFSAIAMKVKIERKHKVLVKSDSIDKGRILELEDLLEEMQDQVHILENKNYEHMSECIDLFRKRSEDSNQQWKKHMEKQSQNHEDEVQKLFSRIKQLENDRRDENIVEILDSDDERNDIHANCRAEINRLNKLGAELQLKSMQLKTNLYEKEVMYREMEEKLRVTAEQLCIENRRSTKHLERVVELEELKETYDISMRLDDVNDSCEWEDNSCIDEDGSKNSTMNSDLK